MAASEKRNKTRKEAIESWPFLRWIASRNRWCVDTRTKDGGGQKFFETREAAVVYRDEVKARREREGQSAFEDSELAEFGLTVSDAIRFTLQHYRRLAASVPISTAVAALVTAKKAANLSEVYCSDIKARLTRLIAAFPDYTLAQPTTDELDAFLIGLGVAPGTRNTFRRDICTLWNFGASGNRKWCDASVATATQLAKVEFERVEIFTPSQMRRLLDAATPDVLPALVIGAFCPIRASELSTLDWSRVNLDARRLTVEGGKKNARRTMTIPDNAITWLKSRVWTGPIVPKNFRSAMDLVRVKAGFKPSYEGRRDETLKKLLAEAHTNRTALEEWPNNGLRHSAITYKLALHRDIAEVSIESGNTPPVIRASYDNLAMPDIAEEYFGLLPTLSPREAELARWTQVFGAEAAAKLSSLAAQRGI